MSKIIHTFKAAKNENAKKETAKVEFDFSGVSSADLQKLALRSVVIAWQSQFRASSGKKASEFLPKCDVQKHIVESQRAKKSASEKIDAILATMTAEARKEWIASHAKG